MATPNKRREASSRERTPDPQPPKPAQPQNGKPCAPTPRRSGPNLERTLQLVRSILEDTQNFLLNYAPFLDDQIGQKASDISADICKYLPRVEEHLADFSAERQSAAEASNGGKGGAS